MKSAVGGLSPLAQHETGTVPSIVASVKTGETLTTTARPAPLTDGAGGIAQLHPDEREFGGLPVRVSVARPTTRYDVPLIGNVAPTATSFLVA